MLNDIDLTKDRNNFVYAGRKFELRRNWDFECDEVIVRYELFINGRELDLSMLLDEEDELDEYIALPYAPNGNVLSRENFPRQRLLEFIQKIVDRYTRASRKAPMFL